MQYIAQHPAHLISLIGVYELPKRVYPSLPCFALPNAPCCSFMKVTIKEIFGDITVDRVVIRPDKTAEIEKVRSRRTCSDIPHLLWCAGSLDSICSAFV